MKLYQLLVAQFVVISQVFERISDRLVPLCSWVQLGLVRPSWLRLWQKPSLTYESALIRFDMSEYMEKFALVV